MNHTNPKITIISDKSDNNDKSAIDNYSSKSKGKLILKNGKLKERKCLTTRKDGDIFVKVENGNLKIYC